MTVLQGHAHPLHLREHRRSAPVEHAECKIRAVVVLAPCDAEPTVSSVKRSIVTWQLRRLHKELDAIDGQAVDVVAPLGSSLLPRGKSSARDRAARRAHVSRLLRALPKRFGFRDARAFARAFASVHQLESKPKRRRLSADQIRELEHRVLNNDRPADIAKAIGCAVQTVLNRASQLRKRLADICEQDASGI